VPHDPTDLERVARGLTRAAVWAAMTLIKVLEDSLSRDRPKRRPPPR
jgi:hypothetical protein